METNKYLPPALPLLSDGRLFRTLRDYEAVYDKLERSDSSAAMSERVQLEKALRAIQHELNARGIGGEPWWAARQPADRGPRTFRGNPVAGGVSRRVRG